jgi:uncharacterized protein DUF4258
MSQTFDAVQLLVTKGDILVSAHGYDELAADDIVIEDVIQGAQHATIIEDYPDYPKGPCVHVLEHDSQGRPIHVVWGVPLGEASPAVVVTAYRPDPTKWESDFARRLK